MIKMRAAWSCLLSIVVALIFLTVPGCTQEVPKASVGVEWEKTFPGPGDESSLLALKTSDGGLILAGSTNCQYAPSALPRPVIAYCDIRLIKTDANGNVEWESHKSSDWWHPDSVRQTPDGGFVFWWGHTSTKTLKKTDSAGNEEWEKKFHEIRGCSSSFQLTSDGGFIILGTTEGCEAVLIKTDAAGNVEWQKTLGNGSASKIEQTSDDGFIALCNRSDSTVWLTKTDRTGNHEWDETFNHETSKGVVQTTDGGYIVFGLEVDRKFWLMKIESDARLQWDKTFDAPLVWPSSVQQTSDGGCIVIGAEEWLWLMKIDVEGEVEWDATTNVSGIIGKVVRLSDVEYVTLGANKVDGRWAIWVMKVRCIPPS